MQNVPGYQTVPHQPYRRIKSVILTLPLEMPVGLEMPAPVESSFLEASLLWDAVHVPCDVSVEYEEV